MPERNPVKNTSVPCYECTRRKPGCHSSCDDYLRFYNERREMNDALRKERLEAEAVRECHLNRRYRMTTTSKKMSGREYYYRNHVGQNKK